ncbi:hypothetical protein GF351_04570 [Candidatus Woesearchaeota archaeon]|nr:hypothetical protein [Candidatus Woesearchaeota archaeon]
MDSITDALNLSVTQLTFENFSYAQFFEIIKPLALFILGIVVYAVFVFKFYRYLARKDFVRLDLRSYSESLSGKLERFFQIFFSLIESIIITPIMIFLWFGVLVALLILLSKQPASSILLSSAALVAAVRITCYYHESLSQDLAKMVPFALLGVFLVDASVFSVQQALTVARQIPAMGVILLYYLVFVAALEIVLRIVHLVVIFMFPSLAMDEEEDKKR